MDTDIHEIKYLHRLLVYAYNESMNFSDAEVTELLLLASNRLEELIEEQDQESSRVNGSKTQLPKKE